MLRVEDETRRPGPRHRHGMGRRSKLLEPPPSNRGWTGSAAPVREHDAGEGTRRQGYWWGFCSIRNLPSACRRRVAPLMLQFPLFGGGEERRQQVHLGQLDSRTLSAPARPIARPLMCLHIRHIGALSPPMKQPPSTPTFPHQQATKSQYNHHVLACHPSVLSPGDASSRQRGSEARFRAF